MRILAPNYPVRRKIIENKAEKQEMLKRYYETANLQILPDMKFRPISIQLFSGKFKSPPRSVNSTEQLRKVLLKYLPLNVYQNSACFVRSKQVKKKPKNFNVPGYKIASNLFLWNDIVFDQDAKSREESYINTLNLANFIKEKFNLMPDLCVQTNRGYHLHYYHSSNKDIWKVEPSNDPEKREDNFQDFMNNLKNYLESNGLKFDPSSLQTRRVFRLPFSCHSSGVICRVVDIFNKEDSLKILRIWVDTTPK